nr:hypothetical protein pKPN535a_019 [Klebsiella pneumoniae]AXQ86097.1 hypothetical protein pKPC45a_008 [Klebsiella pneumoniae]
MACRCLTVLYFPFSLSTPGRSEKAPAREMHPSNHAGYRAVISRNMGFFRASLALR